MASTFPRSKVFILFHHLLLLLILLRLFPKSLEQALPLSVLLFLHLFAFSPPPPSQSAPPLSSYQTEIHTAMATLFSILGALTMSILLSFRSLCVSFSIALSLSHPLSFCLVLSHSLCLVCSQATFNHHHSYPILPILLFIPSSSSAGLL